MTWGGWGSPSLRSLLLHPAACLIINSSSPSFGPNWGSWSIFVSRRSTTTLTSFKGMFWLVKTKFSKHLRCYCRDSSSWLASRKRKVVSSMDSSEADKIDFWVKRSSTAFCWALEKLYCLSPLLPSSRMLSGISISCSWTSSLFLSLLPKLTIASEPPFGTFLMSLLSSELED